MTSPLGLLEIAGLIRRTGVETETEYIFRHALLRETAYASLLREERVALHCDVGEAIERVYSKGNGEYASVLAHHFLKGDQKDKAFHYLFKAGDEAARVYALAEALDQYGQAIELAKAGHGGSEDIRYLYERIGRMLELGGEYEQAISVYREMEEFGHQSERPGLRIQGLLRRANVYCLPNKAMDLELGERLSKQALKMAEDLDDREAQSLALWNLMKKCEFEEDYPAARDYGVKALDLAEELGLATQRAFLLNDLGGINLNVGRFDEAREINQEAQELWRELDNMPMLADSLCNEMAIHIFQGSYDRALQVSQQASQLSERISNTWGQSFSRYFIYWVYFERGQIQQALEIANECVHYAEKARFVVPLAQTEAEIGLMHAFMGDYRTALARTEVATDMAERYIPAWKPSTQSIEMLCNAWAGDLERARQLLPEVGKRNRLGSKSTMTFLDFVLSIALPELALAEERWEDALNGAQKFKESFDEKGLAFIRPDLQFFMGKARLGLGQLDQAETELEEAREAMEKLGSQRSLWRVFAALAHAAEMRGDIDRAKEYRSKAKKVIEHIADHCPSPELRRSFMQRTEVKVAIQGKASE